MSLALILLVISIVWIVIGTTHFKLHPFWVLLSASLFLAVGVGIPLEDIPVLLGNGFGKTFQSIGLLILFGTSIGVLLEGSNATHRIAAFVLHSLQKLPLPYAVSCIGYLVSIPVFCDSAFVILSALNKPLSQKTKTPLVALTVALSTGLFAPHVLVPPTPGPLAAAANLELENLFLLILFGGILALLLVMVGAAYAHWISRKKSPVSEVSNTQEQDVSIDGLPSLSKSLLPILVPLALMGLGTLLQFQKDLLPQPINAFLLFICHPTPALLTGVLFAFRLLPYSKENLKKLTEKGIETAAPILVITGLGGTLGAIIQQLPLAQFTETYLVQPQWGIVIPFVIAAVLKTAQGSSTVAIITTSSIIFPLLGSLGLDSEMGKVWAILSLGVGSMTVSHANDSYFWIVSQLGELDIKTAYRHHTFGTFLQGVVGILLILLGYTLSNFLF